MQQERKSLQRKMVMDAFYQQNTNEKLFYVPKNWIFDWRRQINGDRYSNFYSPKLNEKITEEITCLHGNLAVTDNKYLIPQSVWNYLKASFDQENYFEFPQETNSCPICQEEVDTYKQIVRVRREERATEKVF